MKFGEPSELTIAELNQAPSRQSVVPAVSRDDCPHGRRGGWLFFHADGPAKHPVTDRANLLRPVPGLGLVIQADALKLNVILAIVVRDGRLVKALRLILRRLHQLYLLPLAP